NRGKKIPEQKQNFRVDKWIAAPESFGADLMELTKPALLRPLAAKHRAQVIELSHRLALVHLRLDVSAHHTGRALGTQCDLRPISVIEGVHFLLDDVRRLADGTAEELGFLGDRDADLGEIISSEDLPRRGFDPLPDPYLLGQDVRKSFDAGHF